MTNEEIRQMLVDQIGEHDTQALEDDILGRNCNETHLREARLAALDIEDPDVPATRAGDWMQTFSGKQFWPLDPRADEIEIVDIAHSLSMQCRYGGHSLRFYSVAEHSIYVSYLVPPEMAMWGLLHDAAEAYASDMIRPIKPFLTGYRDIEARLMAAVCERFGLPPVEPPEVKVADKQICVDEMEQVMLPPPAPWDTAHLTASGTRIECLSPAVAKLQFLERFAELSPLYSRDRWVAMRAAGGRGLL